ncbi:unnamed protein product [Leptosia nina]|uniref:Uncharacterized protein n=1 Tax=Leptosia nina TaxID=320188 RepID=A0AAV1J7Q4_9NEOP
MRGRIEGQPGATGRAGRRSPSSPSFAARPRRNKRTSPVRHREEAGLEWGIVGVNEVFSAAIPTGRHMRTEFAAHIVHVALWPDIAG